MICDGCGRKIAYSHEHGTLEITKSAQTLFVSTICKHCVKVVEQALKKVVQAGVRKHLPDRRKFNER